MKLRYTRIPDRQQIRGFSLYPLAQLKLRTDSAQIQLRALIDSGAHCCLFNISIATALGIDPYAGVEHELMGVGGQVSAAYMHRVSFQLEGEIRWQEIEVAFTEADTVPLLGRTGFFEKNQIIFEQYRGRFEVNPRTRPRLRR